MFRLSMILLTSLELVFLKLNVELHDLFFIILIIGFLAYEVVATKIGSYCLNLRENVQ